MRICCIGMLLIGPEKADASYSQIISYSSGWELYPRQIGDLGGGCRGKKRARLEMRRDGNCKIIIHAVKRPNYAILN